MPALTPDLLLQAYAFGIFPMAESAEDTEVFWVDPVERGIIPLDAFHVPKRLARTVRGDSFEVRCDTAFEAVIRACAEPTADRPQTWINDDIIAVYNALFMSGHAHSVETWARSETGEEALVGGLYGVHLGAAFFGESMFCRVRDASKVALVHLVARLVLGGFTLLDTQFVTEHLERFGAIEIPRQTYRVKLAEAVRRPAYFPLELPAGFWSGDFWSGNFFGGTGSSRQSSTPTS